MSEQVVDTSTTETVGETTEKVVPVVEETTTDNEGKEESEDIEKKDESLDSKSRRQSRLDKRFHDLTSKAKAAVRETNVWRESLQEVTGEAPPDRDKYETLEDYRDAIEDYRDRIRTPKVMLQQAEKSAEKAQSELRQVVEETFANNVAEAADEMPDYGTVVGKSNIPMSNAVLDAIMEMPGKLGPRIAYYLATNEDVAYDLSNMSVRNQLLELGRLESKVQVGRKAVPAHKVEQVRLEPPASTTLRGSTPAKAKAPGDMSLSEFAAWRAKGGGK